MSLERHWACSANSGFRRLCRRRHGRGELHAARILRAVQGRIHPRRLNTVDVPAAVTTVRDVEPGHTTITPKCANAFRAAEASSKVTNTCSHNGRIATDT